MNDPWSRPDNPGSAIEGAPLEGEGYEGEGAEPPHGLGASQRVQFQQSGPAARKRPGTTAWDVLLIIDLVALFLLLVGGALLAATQDLGEPTITTEVLWGEIAFSFLAFTIIPLAWLMGTRAAPLTGTLRYLGLYRFGPSVLWGALWTLALFAALSGFAYVYEAAGGNLDNPALEAMLDVITWPAAIGLALAAGIGEEIVFRGILQKKVGLWGQAVLFGIAHASYGTALQVVLPFALGVFFGYLIRRGNSLWVPITTHVLFDLVALTASRWGL